MITNDAAALEAVKSEEYMDLDNIYSLIPVEIRLHMQRTSGYCTLLLRLVKNIYKDDDIDYSYLLKNADKIFRYHDIGYGFLPIKNMCNDGESDSKILNMRKFYEIDFAGDNNSKGHTNMGAVAFDIPLFGKYSKDIMEYAVEVASSHHERWDGLGFPKGLKKEEIPLTARICAVADMYDLFAQQFPHISGEDNSNILDVLSQVSGTYLEPKLVDIVKNNKDSFMNYDRECGNIRMF